MNTVAERRLIIATRKSPLALWQAEHVRKLLQDLHPGWHCELLTMETQGDKILDVPLAKIGGKGLFLKELEHALQDGRADIAVHSMKDVPVALPEGLGIGAILAREDPRDALVAAHDTQVTSLASLPEGAIVGTSSLRRACQLRSLRPDIRIRDLRGNVGTRLAKLDGGQYDAIILAAAGLKRLALAARISCFLPPTTMLPAIGQGAMGIECRLDRDDIKDLISPLKDPDTMICVMAERALNEQLGGGCQAPIAGHAELHAGRIQLTAMVGKLSGGLLQAEGVSCSAAGSELGVEVADSLIRQGARGVLEEWIANESAQDASAPDA